MSLTKTKQPFLALSKICLNNWHYIDQKVLSFNDGINFFTGHSGSGKSTVIDAMQIVLYANTDGRGFFNKAAADDSDRNLIEYLRGMVAVGEKDEVTYLRNKNFSTTIVLEFTQTESDEKECLGVVFDVDTARNDTSRLFFWHKGGILENAYRTEEHAMTISELRKYMQKNFKKEDFYFGTSNERFRKQHIEGVLGQHHAALAQHLGAVQDRVHQQVLVGAEVAHVHPCEEPLLREDVGVPHGMAGAVLGVLIIKHRTPHALKIWFSLHLKTRLIHMCKCHTQRLNHFFSSTCCKGK